MNTTIQINTKDIALAGGVRPKQGAKKNAEGNYAETDLEVVIIASMGAVRVGSIVDAGGKHIGAMVPVGEVSCSLAAFTKLAGQMLASHQLAGEIHAVQEQARKEAET